MRIGIDAMGADNAPAEEVKGALSAREILGKDDRIVLIGVEPQIRALLDAAPSWQDFIEIVHTDQVIKMDDKPVEALKAKPRASIPMMAQLHAMGKIDACISAGNTGACVAAASVLLRRLKGVQRPGIAVVTPTYYGPVVLCDVGANVSCRPQHLYQYGVMASLYSQTICGVKNPRVALMSVGEEEAKGNDLVKRTHELLKAEPNVNFVGNAEGRDIFRGTADVVICEGFVGNVVLKLMEGMAEAVIKSLVAEAALIVPDHLDAVKKTTRSMVQKWDFNEYGGAPLLGVDGIYIICHGASNYRGIRNAVRAAKEFAAQQVNPKIVEVLGKDEGLTTNE